MNKKLLIALGCASMLVCGCDKKMDEGNNKVEDQKLVTVVLGNKYDIYSHLNSPDRPEYENEGVIIDFSYPEVHIDSEDINAMNKTIKESYEAIEKELPKTDSNGCICIKKDDKYYCNGEHLESQEYLTYETDDYLTIQLRKVGRTYCAGSYDSYSFYNISKDTKKLLSNSEVLSALKFNQTSFEHAIKEEYKKNYGMELDSLDDVTYGITDNEHLIVVIPSDNDDNVYIYNGNTLTLIK